jgi:hypothetical protein
MKSPKQLLSSSEKRRKWPRDTFTLLSKHITGGAMDSQNYVDWAVLALMDGFDTQSLAILAGLDLGYSYPGERYDYFRRSIKELGIDTLILRKSGAKLEKRRLVAAGDTDACIGP